MGFGIILYGPPASGKSTLTRELSGINEKFSLFRRIKAGQGRKDEYRMVSQEELERARSHGDVVWENHRYGSTYAIDRDGLRALMEDRIPVVHLGQPEAVKAVMEVFEGRWLVVALSCSRTLAIERILERETGDSRERISAWDETPRLAEFDLFIDTGLASPGEAAKMIADNFREKFGDLKPG